MRRGASPSLSFSSPAGWLRALVSLLAVALTAWTARGFAFNPTTLALLLVVVILFVAMGSGRIVTIACSIFAAALLNYFFLPPVGTWRIAQGEDWIALGAFVAVSLIASRLVLGIRREAEVARTHQSELEMLYRLSVALFSSSTRDAASREATARAMESVGADQGGLVLFGGSSYRQDRVHWEGPWRDEFEDVVAGVGRHQREAEFGGLLFFPLVTGGRVAGVLVIGQSHRDPEALRSVARLVAIAVERERLSSENAHVIALQESEALKTALLRAVSHDLSTPLTAMSLQIESLRRELRDQPGPLDTVSRLDEESARLRSRVAGLLAFARLEAGALRPRPEPTPAADLFRAVRDHLPLLALRRTLRVRVDPACPDVQVDPGIALEILVNLVENADHASPPDQPIELTASPEGAGERVVLEVRDRGSGVPFDFREGSPGDLTHRGLGLEIARGLTAASGGTLVISDGPGGGTVARIVLRSAQVEAQP